MLSCSAGDTNRLSAVSGSKKAFGKSFLFTVLASLLIRPSYRRDPSVNRCCLMLMHRRPCPIASLMRKIRDFKQRVL